MSGFPSRPKSRLLPVGPLDVSSEHDWFDVLEFGDGPPLFRTSFARQSSAIGDKCENIAVETDAGTFAAVATEWADWEQERRREILLELGELHLARVAIASLPDGARAQAERRVAELGTTDHRQLAKEVRGVLGEVRRDDPEARAQALNAPVLGKRDQEAYQQLRILRALVCE